ncbi:MAG: hypothetical protein ACO3A4_12575 [Silvanigrellaceae bacterium]
MTLDWLAKLTLLCLVVSSAAHAASEDAWVPFPQLIERTVGTAGKSVRFDWRRKSQLFFLDYGQPVEYNNFETERFGASLFLPSSNWSFGFGLAKTFVSSTPSSRAISLMPYQQLGRPERWEILAGAFFPVAEGVTTLRLPILPAAQMVFSLAADFRYLIYPTLYSGSDLPGGLKSLLKIRLNSDELARLGDIALPGMRIDSGKVNVLTGVTLHLYTAGGFIVNSKAMIALGLLGSEMPRHADFSFGIGYAQ